jgi:predicted ATPase
MLRLMTILLQLDIGKLSPIDEIENGINPELIEYLIDHLINSDQILVTLHSPMILNFMDDDVAREESYIYIR